MTRVLALRFDSLGDRSHEMTKRRAQTSCADASNQCHHEMRIVSLINDAQIIERILRHVGMWVNEVCNHGVRISPSTGPPVEESVAVSGIFDRGQLVIEPWLDDPMPDDDCGL